jgi:hypothetical protein
MDGPYGGDRPPTDPLDQPIDERTGLRPIELDFLRDLSAPQREAIVTELGGVWPAENDSAAEQVYEEPAIAEPTEEPAKETSPELADAEEQEHAVVAITSNPQVTYGIDFWDEGAAYSVWSKYKIGHASDETRGSEMLRNDFHSLLLISRESLVAALPEGTRYSPVVCRLECDDGVTYKLLMSSPKAVDMRPDVDMMVSVPKSAGLEDQLELLESNPTMFLGLFQAFSGNETTRLRGMSKPIKVSALAQKVKTPFILSTEQTTDIVAEQKKRLRGSTYKPTARDFLPPLNPPSLPVVVRPTPTPPQRRKIWGNHKQQGAALVGLALGCRDIPQPQARTHVEAV